MSKGPWKKGRQAKHITDSRLKGGKTADAIREEKAIAKAMGLDYIEKVLPVYVNGPGEIAPKRSYFTMGRSIHRGLAATIEAKRKLGSNESQHDFFRRIFLQSLDELNQMRKIHGMEAIEIDPTVWVDPDRIQWAAQHIHERIADHAANGRLTKRKRKVLVDEAGVPEALKP